jgi:hypothetical protein
VVSVDSSCGLQQKAKRRFTLLGGGLRARSLLVALVVLAGASCNDNGIQVQTTYENSIPPPGVVDHPTTINVYPVGYAVDPRIFINVSVGNVPVTVSVAFDTGSAGLTLNALAIFPASVVTEKGFIFPSGQNSITYNGIIVTDQVGTRSYGGSGGRTETGNIGYAQVTFGDADGELTTDTMPVLLYYSVTENATGEPALAQPQQGWFGVNAASNDISVAGSSEPLTGYPECTPEATGTCSVVSVLKYLDYWQDVDAGFVISEISFESCDITTPGSCAPQPSLTVGLIEPLEQGYVAQTLSCPPDGYVGAETIRGYLVCSPEIPNATVTLSGPVTASLPETVLFDSGNPSNDIHQSGGALPALLPAETAVTVATPSGFVYAYTAGVTGTLETSIGPSISTGFGINFFTQHSLFIDFITNVEAWR